MSARDPLRPGRPGVCAYARIDEAKVGSTGQGAAWLAEETQWFHRAGMLTVVGECIVGGTVYLHCHKVERAQELVDLAVRHGVPANCVRAVTRLDKSKAGAA
ncbi:hypothetical protein NLX86_19035 [Streptomyces sp. A3M-1-3]|uniref:hypothetical protein n=1 Tax=Streptomyces sp. A3M-1-3 TaxID=2962044 RepID=UPI0020B64093|nr:hypothetical protein [Streptomyces sp. A3M-1-3]MCP3820114.1 hypothetical protein [Streptomyces sp. A3M-1-3]